METRAISSDGCAIAFRVEGPRNAPTLLLSNSLGANLDMWEPQVAAFSGSLRLIRYDTRGHGGSDAPSGEYTIDQLGRDALAVLDGANVARAHVCGLSLGGMTAIWLGAHAPRRVASLVLAATAARIGSPEMWRRRVSEVRAGGTASIADVVMTRWFTDRFRAGNPEMVAHYRQMLTSTRNEGYIGCCHALRNADVREAIGTIDTPTLVVVGSSDPVTPPSDGENIRRRVPGADMVTLDAAHLVSVEQAAAFNRRVLRFLARTPPTK